MPHISHNRGLRPDPSHTRWAPRSLFPWLSLLLFFGAASSTAAKGADLQNAPVTSAGPGPQFAIADFDGDLHPDLASIQAGQTAASTGTSTYWIQLRLSAVGLQSIRLVAPAGGLRIEARDVNGDRAVDLVVATAWFRQPVAILLNDGHGGFSQIEPAAFPAAFSESTPNWGNSSNQAMEAIAFPPPLRSGLGVERTASPHLASGAGSVAPFSAAFLPTSFLTSHAGRAPPSEIRRF